MSYSAARAARKILAIFNYAGNAVQGLRACIEYIAYSGSDHLTLNRYYHLNKRPLGRSGALLVFQQLDSLMQTTQLPASDIDLMSSANEFSQRVGASRDGYHFMIHLHG